MIVGGRRRRRGMLVVMRTLGLRGSCVGGRGGVSPNWHRRNRSADVGPRQRERSEHEADHEGAAAQSEADDGQESSGHAARVVGGRLRGG
jgi:hypothetical protein